MTLSKKALTKSALVKPQPKCWRISRKDGCMSKVLKILL